MSHPHDILGAMKKLMRLSGRQHGAFTWDQAIDSGVAPTEIKVLVRRGVIERVVLGVYRVVGSPDTWRQRLMIAVLAAGEGAAVSRRAAAALLGIRGYDEGIVEITQTRRPSRRHPYGIEHSSRYLPAEHVQLVDGIPVTTVERTVMDLCASCRTKRAEWLVKTVVSMKLTTIGKLATLLTEMAKPGRKGISLLRATLAALDDEPMDATELEKLVIAVIKAAGLPLPVREVQVGGTTAPVGRIDFLYRTARIVIEADSKAWHGNWVATEDDQRRDKKLIAAGYYIVRTNWRELVQEPELLTDALAALLEARAA